MACILIVEDNPTNMKLASYLLEHAGHAVLKAEDAIAGLRLAHEQHPDLVLMDIQLPGMDGVAALQELRADSDTAQLKVAALTAHAMKGDRERLLATGFDGYFSKPIHHKEFLAGIVAMLDGAGGGKPAAVPGKDDDHG